MERCGMNAMLQPHAGCRFLGCKIAMMTPFS